MPSKQLKNAKEITSGFMIRKEKRYCNISTVNAYLTKISQKSHSKVLREHLQNCLNETNVALILDEVNLRTAKTLVRENIVTKRNIYSPNEYQNVCDANKKWGITPFKGMLSKQITKLIEDKISPNIVVIDAMTNVDGSKKWGHIVEDIFNLLKHNKREWIILEITLSQRNKKGNFENETQFDTTREILEKGVFVETQWKHEFREGTGYKKNMMYLTYILTKDTTIDPSKAVYIAVDNKLVGFAPNSPYNNGLTFD